MESIIRKEIGHMKKNNLFSHKQYGFIIGRSTSGQQLKVLDIRTYILDMDGQIDIIYVDFMKAFDQVPHRRLVGKIDGYGIGSVIIDWISDLSNQNLQVYGRGYIRMSLKGLCTPSGRVGKCRVESTQSQRHQRS